MAEDNPEIRTEMFDACKDVRASGSLIEQLCSLTAPSLRANANANGSDGGDIHQSISSSTSIIDSVYSDSEQYHHYHQRYPLLPPYHHHESDTTSPLPTVPPPPPFPPPPPGSVPSPISSIRSYTDRTAMSRAARALLSSVTRVLLVADTVVIKQILTSKDRVSRL